MSIETILQEIEKDADEHTDKKSVEARFRRNTARLRVIFAEAVADNEKLNRMLHDTHGYGQGEINAYVEQCEQIEKLEAALQLWLKDGRACSAVAVDCEADSREPCQCAYCASMRAVSLVAK